MALSYADAAAKGPKQSPKEAAAAPVPTVVSRTDDTHALIDVDSPAVRTVPNDFLERDVQTSTQAARLEREAAAAEARKVAEKKAAAAKERRSAAAASAASRAGGRAAADATLGTGALVLANLALVLGVGAAAHYFGADHGRWAPSWRNAGLGVGVAAALGLGESVLVQNFRASK
ncbi:hypothetical protein CFIMG_003466RAa [Ceratocystis fimbriata CBS 114723]|uniref:Mitochondrial outer membrane protein OM14 C-terminal domain-containing protein n=1 Tax=Ceratocystis fimbriata CBS 114723 TaxID=1035309 RepID=A0A2C5XKM3_9PEZI|nr:hypothetical protein CFIMG_003466RAa [Ceratocystis fimbriata CBS 114723]